MIIIHSNQSASRALKCYRLCWLRAAPDIYRLYFQLSRQGGVPLKRDGEVQR
jgi:hypothetical protein